MGKQQRHGALDIANGEKSPETPRETPATPRESPIRRDLRTGMTVIDVQDFEVVHDRGTVVLRIAARDGATPLSIGLAFTAGGAWKLSQRIGVAAAQTARDAELNPPEDTLPAQVVAREGGPKLPLDRDGGPKLNLPRQGRGRKKG